MTEPAPLRNLLSWVRRRRRRGLMAGSTPITRAADVRELVDELDLAATVTYTQLAEQLALIRRRPIRIQPYPNAIVDHARRTDEPLPYGVWIAKPAAEYVFYREDTTLTHQRHIILHELGHIFCRHIGQEIGPASNHQEIPDHAAITEAVKRAGGFAEDQEQSAELFAYLFERRTRPNLSASGDTPAARFRLLED